MVNVLKRNNLPREAVVSFAGSGSPFQPCAVEMRLFGSVAPSAAEAPFIRENFPPVYLRAYVRRYAR